MKTWASCLLLKPALRLDPRKQQVLAAMLLGAVLLVSESHADNERVTVDTVEDRTDFGGAQQVADLPGPDGRISFREACLATNNTPGPQTIEFAIPSNEWWLYNDRAILRLEHGAFSINDDETTIDFTTQTEFSGDTNPNGWEVGIYGTQPNAWGIAAIFVNSNHCVIKGLDRVMMRGYGVELTGDYNRVMSSSISGPLYAGVMVEGYVNDPATGNVIGGEQPGDGNVLSGGNAGIRIDGPTDGTVVIGNTLVGSPYFGIQVRGAACCPEYTPINTRIGGPTPAERNWIADNGKFGEEGFPLGGGIQIERAIGTRVEGNYIGVNANGSASVPNAHGTSGVSVRHSSATEISNNVISGIRKVGVNHYDGQVFGVGIEVSGADNGTVIHGNKIGTDATGQNAVPNLNGIQFGWFQGNPTNAIVGGSQVEDANLVAFNERNGITIGSSVVEVRISSNSIHSNGLLGIDLLELNGQSGVTQNDPGDLDTGGNGLQNFPALESVVSNGSATTITGALNSIPNTVFTVQFFASGSCDPSGFGEGEIFVGEVSLLTDETGDAEFSHTFPIAFPDGWWMSSTATIESPGATSEFSPCVEIQNSSFPPASFGVTAGTLVSGSLSDLEESDNSDISGRRSHSDTSSRVFIEVEGNCPLSSPTSLEIVVEASVFARSPVRQSVDLYNFDTGAWEEIDVRNASRFVDSTVVVSPSGDLSRFVESQTGNVGARCRFESDNRRQQFSANVDRIGWTVSDD